MDKLQIARFQSELVRIGKLILSWQLKAKNRDILSPEEFKTHADELANSLIKGVIKEIFSDAVVFSEEDRYVSQKRPNEYWLIDPIDGTASWYNGFKGYVSQVCFLDDRQVKYSAIYAPALTSFGRRHMEKGRL